MATRSVICLPGILARSEEQHRPLWLERYADTVLYEDVQPQQSFEDYIDHVVSQVESEHSGGRSVVIIGSSFGGDISAFVHQRLQTDHADIDDWLRLIIVDAPAGISTFKAIKWMKPGILTSSTGTLTLKMVGRPFLWANRTFMGLPDDKYITFPSDDVMRHLAGRADFSEEQWKQYVRKTAKEGLSGQSATLWRRQLQWMTDVAEKGSLEEAARSLNGHDVWYIQCTDGNAVVVQPKTQQWWAERIGTNRVRTVEAPHCGYLQMQPEFELKIKSLVRC